MQVCVYRPRLSGRKVCVCMYVCMYVDVFVHMYIHEPSLSIHAWVEYFFWISHFLPIRTYTWKNKMHVNMHRFCTNTFMSAHTYAHIYVHTLNTDITSDYYECQVDHRKNVHIHTWMHTHTHIGLLSWMTSRPSCEGHTHTYSHTHIPACFQECQADHREKGHIHTYIHAYIHTSLLSRMPSRLLEGASRLETPQLMHTWTAKSCRSTGSYYACMCVCIREKESNS